MAILFIFIALVVLIMISAFFSGSETSMMSLNRYRLKHLSGKGNKRARRAHTMLRRPERLLGTILIGNTFANIIASSLATIIGDRLLGDVGIALSTVILTLAILIFAEVLPKTIAALHPESYAFPASLPLQWSLRVLYPLVWLVNSLVKLILKPFGVHSRKNNTEALTLEEIRTVVHASSQSLVQDHKNMLMGVLDLQHATVEDVMVPRHQMLGIDLNQSLDKILEQIYHSPYSRLPIYNDDLDNLVGILSLKRLVKLLQKPITSKEDLIRFALKPYFIPESTSLYKQLTHFQKTAEQMGLVVDEYGSILGLLTLEDILEEIAGEFTSETQPSVNDETVPQADGSFIVKGSMTVRDVNRDCQMALPTDGPKTLNGLILEYLEAIPSSQCCVLIKGHPIEILSVKNNTVKKVRIFPQLTRYADE